MAVSDIIWNWEIQEKVEVMLYKIYYLPILTHGDLKRLTDVSRSHASKD
jgi:hypothetical protein